jgi:fumarate reductase flavoprotein subunit
MIMGLMPLHGVDFELSVPIVIVGGGACGLCAALAASERGSEVIVLERDKKPSGNTSLSGALIPASGTRMQREKGIVDSPERFVADIMAKNNNQADAKMAWAIAKASAPTVEWLADEQGIDLRLVEGFLYPGHSLLRMHATPNRTGKELEGALLRAVSDKSIDVVTNAHVINLFAEADGRVKGLQLERPDGIREKVGCDALILACNGFAGNPEMVRTYIPEMTGAPYFGHEGNMGDAIRWGMELGAAVEDMGSYQGHGALAHPHGIAVWDTLTDGGFQVNLEGNRFSNEAYCYSAQALEVLRQPGSVVWNIYDKRGHDIARVAVDYRDAIELGAVRRAVSIAELAAKTQLPEEALKKTILGVEEMAWGKRKDLFGRNFTDRSPLKPPYYAIRVTGALFHTQGGLVVDENARVVRQDGTILPNLFAGGGAARGLSGPAGWGYLSGNGLLTATVLGRLAGHAAAALVRQ